MSKDYVSKELARKLQEKGYPLKKVYRQDEAPLFYDLPQDHSDWSQCDAWYLPSIWEVLKWLREEKKLYIEIWWLTQHTTKNLKGFQFIITPMCENPQRETDLELYCDYETTAIKGIEYAVENVI